MADIFVGSVSVGVVPDAREWNTRLRSELVPSADSVGKEIGSVIGQKIAENLNIGAAVYDSTVRGTARIAAAGTRAAQTFADAFKLRLDAALRDFHPDVNVNVKLNTSRAKADLASSGLGDIAAATAGGAGGGGGGGMSGLPLIGGLPLPAQIAAIGTAIAALPFIAQAAAGTIVFALGGALAGLGIAGAIMSGKLTAQFDKLKTNAQKDLEDIGKPFIPVLQNIMSVAQNVLKTMTPVFGSVVKVIATPFKLFTDTILKSFTSPAVMQSIRAVSTAFVAILTAFRPDIPGIFNSFAQAITRIATAVSKNPKAFADFLNFLFQIVIALIDAIAWLTNFATYIEVHFLPAVHEIAVVFDGVRHDIAHIWDQIFENTIGTVIRLTHNIETQFNSMRHEIAVIFDGVRHDIAHTWDQIYDNTIGAVIRVWQKTDTPFANMRHDISNTMDGIRHDIAHYWDIIYQDTIGRVIRMMHDVESYADQMRHDLAVIYDDIRHDISAIWDGIWNDTVGRAIRGVEDVYNQFVSLKNKAVGFFSAAGGWLTSAGSDVIGGFLKGMAGAMGDIGSWINTNIVQPVIGAVKHFFGISSPSTVMMPIGQNIVAGMLKGVISSAGDLGGFINKVFGGWPQALGSLVSKSLVDIAKLPEKALSALGKVGGAIGGFFSKLVGGGGGGGVSQWAGVVAQALAMNGLPLSLASQVLYQMQTESGGDPNAINNSDINAQMGDPSRGLLQTIGSTFSAYHVAGTSSNIYDPLANVAAAINYAKNTYGSSLMSGGMGMGSGHGYDTGGWLPPGYTLAYNGTGRHEMVLTADQLAAVRGSDGSAQYVAHFDSLTGAAIEQHVRVAFSAMAMQQGRETRQGRRS